MLHYYVQKGWKIDDFLHEPMHYKLFYMASMQAEHEAIEKALEGGGS